MVSHSLEVPLRSEVGHHGGLLRAASARPWKAGNEEGLLGHGQNASTWFSSILRVDIDAPGGPVNMVIPWDGRPIFGFGSDEAGEAYVTTSSPTGQGVMRLVRDDDSTKKVPATQSGYSP